MSRVLKAEYKPAGKRGLIRGMPRSIRNPWDAEEVLRRLVRIRLALGPDVKDICAQLGYKPNKWSNWENRHNGLSLGEAIHIVERLGLSLDYIYRGKEDAGIAPDVAPRLRKITQEMVLREMSTPKGRGRPRKSDYKSEAAD